MLNEVTSCLVLFVEFMLLDIKVEQKDLRSHFSPPACRRSWQLTGNHREELIRMCARADNVGEIICGQMEVL